MVETQDLAPGDVVVTSHGQGWLLVQIGRGRYTKRFNLSEVEAVKLYRELEAFDQERSQQA